MKLFTDEYIANNVIRYSSKNKVLMNFEFFKLRVDISCLYYEIIDRFLDHKEVRSILKACSNPNIKDTAHSPSANKNIIWLLIS